MVRPNRIKEFRFSEVVSAGATDRTTFTDHVINGEILKVESQYNATGSYALFVSGTDELLFTEASGTGVRVFYPFVYASTNAAVTGSPQAFTETAVNDTLYYVVGSASSGTDALRLTLKYR